MEINEMVARFTEYARDMTDCVIMPHVNADGDCLGSSLALKDFMESIGVRTRILLEEKIPEKYDYLDPDKTLSVYEGGEIEESFIVTLDTGDTKRLGKRFEALKNEVSWNIDHHKTNTLFGKYNYVDISASSTGEIIYNILAGNNYDFSRRTAEALFTAISTDTGGLRYSNTTPGSMRICAALLETGIDISEISHRAFDMMPYPKLRLKCLAIENMRFFCDMRIAVISMKASEYDFLGGRDEYFDGIVNITVNTEGVIAGALIREDGSGYKVNMRSNTDAIDVSSIAGDFGGGGHQRAAGCTIEAENLEQASELIIKRLCGAVR